MGERLGEVGVGPLRKIAYHTVQRGQGLLVAALLDQELVLHQHGAAVAGLLGQDFVHGRLGQVELLVLEVEVSQPGLGVQRLFRRLHRSLVCGLGLLEGAGLVVEIGHDHAQGGVLGKLVDGLLVGGLGLGGVVGLAEQAGEQHARLHLVRELVDHGAGHGLGLGPLAARLVEGEQHLVVGRLVRVDLDGLLEQGLGLLRVLAGEQHAALDQVEPVLLGFQAERLVNGRLGLVELVVRGVDGGEQGERVHMLRLGSEDLVDVLLRPVLVPAHEQELGGLQLGVQVGGIEARGPLQFVEGVLRLTRLQIEQAQLVAGLGEFRVHLDGVAQFDDGRAGIFFLHVGHGLLVVDRFFLFRVTGTAAEQEQHQDDQAAGKGKQRAGSVHGRTSRTRGKRLIFNSSAF